VVFIPLSDDNPLRSIGFQWMTISLIAANVAVFLFQNVELGQTVAASFAVVPSELLQVGLFGGPAHGPFDRVNIPEGYTLLTYMFLHADVLHLASNMLFLWVFGDNVEDAMGHLKFLAFYILCGVAGGLAHAYMLPASKLPLIGASGAVAGVIAAYLILHPRVLVWVLAFRFIPLKISAAWVLGVWVATQLVMVLLNQPDQVAWWAHVGGMAAGAILILFMRRPGVPLFDRRLSSTQLRP
jgi:membrane associated rhomboid family serine protease